MNMGSQHNLMDQIAHYRQNVLKAKRLRNLCLKHTHRMYRQQFNMQMEQAGEQAIPTFMQAWWAMVGDLHTCAIALEDNDPQFLDTLWHYRERAQLQFKL